MVGQKEPRPEGRLEIALAGNPNVGKSTLFNLLTGLRQHTGNWPGKTVGCSAGVFTYKNQRHTVVDTPGSYSLLARSEEEEAARDFLCFGMARSTVVVCDATCLEHSLPLALQIIETTGRAVVCVNLLDEAEKKGIHVDLKRLSGLLGVPVTGTAASRGEGLKGLLDTVFSYDGAEPAEIELDEKIRDAVTALAGALKGDFSSLPPVWLALRLLEGDESMLASLRKNLGLDPAADPELSHALDEASRRLAENGVTPEGLCDMEAARINRAAGELCSEVLTRGEGAFAGRDGRIDRVLTHRALGPLVMAALLALVLWLTIAGANLPSELLSRALARLGDALEGLFLLAGAPPWITGIFIDGAYRTLAWVVAVMLPPMAIFFPLFTLLEDLGYLPRVAFNLDGFFKKCSACGKQGLTM